MHELGYRKLIVWKKADELAYQIYRVVKKFPSSELYGLVSQMRRASFSIPTNIVEGYARKSRKEFKQFVNIALARSLGDDFKMFFLSLVPCPLSLYCEKVSSCSLLKSYVFPAPKSRNSTLSKSVKW